MRAALRLGAESGEARRESLRVGKGSVRQVPRHPTQGCRPRHLRQPPPQAASGLRTKNYGTYCRRRSSPHQAGGNRAHLHLRHRPDPQQGSSGTHRRLAKRVPDGGATPVLSGCPFNLKCRGGNPPGEVSRKVRSLDDQRLNVGWCLTHEQLLRSARQSGVWMKK